jgi:hypothetical protein
VARLRVDEVLEVLDVVRRVDGRTPRPRQVDQPIGAGRLETVEPLADGVPVHPEDALQVFEVVAFRAQQDGMGALAAWERGVILVDVRQLFALPFVQGAYIA